MIDSIIAFFATATVFSVALIILLISTCLFFLYFFLGNALMLLWNWSVPIAFVLTTTTISLIIGPGNWLSWVVGVMGIIGAIGIAHWWQGTDTHDNVETLIEKIFYMSE